MRIPFNHVDVEPGSLSCTIDETVTILKHKQRSVMYRGDYIEYNDETKSMTYTLTYQDMAARLMRKLES